MGNGLSKFYSTYTCCTEHSSTSAEEINRELTSSVSNSNNTSNFKYQNDNTSKRSRKNVNNIKTRSDSKEMESLHIWSTKLNKALSIYESNDIRDYSAPKWSDITNIYVYIRVKPFIATELDIMLSEDNDNENPFDSVTIDNNNITIQHQNNKCSNQFTRKYDNIFDGITSQKQIYSQIAAPLMQACVDGFNLTIFAYGPIDCGKSHTIFGSSVEFGIAQRCVATLAYHLNEKHTLDKIDAFKIFLSGLRICDTQLYDLFNFTDNEQQLLIKPAENERNCAFVEGLVELEVMSLEDTMKVIHNSIVEKDFDGCVNDIVLIVKIEQLINNMDGSGKSIESELKLVQCKASKSMRTVNDFDMYDLIEEMDEETPFNHLMSDSFEGNRITTMIGCISSDSIHVSEAIDTLKFASAVMNIRNEPTANINEWWDNCIEINLTPFQLMIDPKKTFGEIKNDISKIIKIDAKEISLMSNGVYLRDEQILRDSKVQKKGVIKLSRNVKSPQLGVHVATGISIGYTDLDRSVIDLWHAASKNDTIRSITTNGTLRSMDTFRSENMFQI